MYKHGLFGKKFQWLLLDSSSGSIERELALVSTADGAEYFNTTYGCTRQNLLEAAEGSIVYAPESLTEEERDSVTGVSGRVRPVVAHKIKRALFSPMFFLVFNRDAAVQRLNCTT